MNIFGAVGTIAVVVGVAIAFDSTPLSRYAGWRHQRVIARRRAGQRDVGDYCFACSNRFICYRTVTEGKTHRTADEKFIYLPIAFLRFLRYTICIENIAV
jgi:hypothetical protein